MYIVQVKKPIETWIVAICQIEEDATTYLKTLPVEIQAEAFIFEIPFEYFPFILIQNTQLHQNSDFYFEYCNFDALQSRLDATREHKADSEDHVYFNYYYISEPYSQMVTEENFMKYLRHTSVSNQVLNEPYTISFFHEEIKKNAAKYDLDRLDQLFELTKTRFTSAREKEDLALNGYESLFWEMNYDHACGKLTDAGITYLLPMVDNMEILLSEKKWQHRSFAQHILLENACKEHPETALQILEDTIEAFHQYLISNPEEKLEIHRLLSIAYQWMMVADSTHACKYWKLAVSEITHAVEYAPEKASWSSLLELIYMSPEDETIAEAQHEAQKNIQSTTTALEKKLGARIAYPIALAYQHLQSYLERNKIGNRFPETLAISWAEKALGYDPEETTRIDLHESAEFFSQIGYKTNRIDFLQKTISIYEHIMKAIDDCALEVYNITNIRKQIAEIHLKNGEGKLADKSITQAQTLYTNHINLVKRNPSAHLHYAEFLEYCYTYDGNIEKPTLQELTNIANEIEIESEGFLSYPYVLLMRIALFENNEDLAILECTKSLILHELCADTTFDKLIEACKDASFLKVNAFLNETKSFMKEVSGNYYYNPDMKWEDVRKMSPEEIRAYWNKRKKEIINRPSPVRE